MNMLTVTTAARRCGLSPARIRKACADGELKAVLVGKTYFFSQQDFEEWFASRRKPGNPNW